MTQGDRRTIAATAGLLLALALVPLFARGYVLSIAILVLQYAYLGQSWNILAGFGGQFSFGHAVFFGTGAYAMGVLQVKFGWSAWPALGVALAAGASVGAFIGELLEPDPQVLRHRVDLVFPHAIDRRAEPVVLAIVHIANRSGQPLRVPAANSALNNLLFRGNSFANRVADQPLFVIRAGAEKFTHSILLIERVELSFQEAKPPCPLYSTAV